MAPGRCVALGRGLGLVATLEAPQALPQALPGRLPLGSWQAIVRPQALAGRLPLVRWQVTVRPQALPGQHKVTASLCLGNQTIRHLYRRQEPLRISIGTKSGIASGLGRRRSGPMQ